MHARLAVVTGASRGIGAAVSGQLVSHGWAVVGVSRSAMAPLAGLHAVQADLADPASRNDALERIVTVHGVPDLVVNNAGAFLLAPLEASSDDLLREQLAINLEAPFAIARHLLPLMRTRGSGRHLLVGSVADWHAFPGNAAYAASKFAVRGLHEVLVEEYRGSGVQCTLVSPGPTDTAVWDPINPDAHAHLPNRADMLRPADVAEAIVWAATRPDGVHVELVRLGPA